MKKRLKRAFFNRPTLEVAQDLLGKYLVKSPYVGQIVEVEAYIAEIDPACHGFRGITPRTRVLFGKPGISYVYFIYGMYHCFNVVTEKDGVGAAVLIRAVKPISGTGMRCDGPGKLCRAFEIDMSCNEVDLCTSKEFYIEDRGKKPAKIKSSRRIGIKKGMELEWRFFI